MLSLTRHLCLVAFVVAVTVGVELCARVFLCVCVVCVTNVVRGSGAARVREDDARVLPYDARWSVPCAALRLLFSRFIVLLLPRPGGRR